MQCQQKVKHKKCSNALDVSKDLVVNKLDNSCFDNSSNNDSNDVYFDTAEGDNDDHFYDCMEPVNIESVNFSSYKYSATAANSDVLEDDDDEDECDVRTVTINNLFRPSIDPTLDVSYGLPRDQIDTGAKVTVTNLLYLLHDVKFYDEKFKGPIKMKGATSNKVVRPIAVENLQIPANYGDNFVDLECYYSNEFNSTLISDEDILQSTSASYAFSG